MLELRILGPLEVLVDGEPVELRRAKQRGLLALLLLSAGEVVSADRLIDELWAGNPPATAKDALQNYVSQLRKALGPEVIVTRPHGYVLEVESEQTDIGHFERLVAAARDADPHARADSLREALALWRGTPLADLAYESFAGLEVARLEEMRAAAQADLVDAELELGHASELLPDLEATIAERPFDERPRAQLMLALYRAGRQADALEAYRQARSVLADELGLDPGAQLRELEQAILRQDAALDRPLALPTITKEQRKTVTILFADLVESTELSEALDPEALRRVLDGYFSAARRAIESHAGTIEKFIGDAVMAVFGVPVAHEDDALRAVRAAVDTRVAVDALSETVQREHGLTLDLRFGINTGDVYVGDPAHGAGLVTGNAVNIAKRLEQAAPTGAIMLGATTLELVRDAVRVKAVKPRGRREEKPLPAFRLLELVEGAPAVARYLEAELVGRDEELTALRKAFEETVHNGSPRLLAVVGEPGIGKTRLANELVSLVATEVTVLTGRCVAYGEGATYAPLREMVSGVDLEAVLAGEEDAELVARRVAELVGLAEGTGSVDEGFWAMRRLFSVLASARPLVLRVGDLHWAGTRLLDLLDQIVELARGPIFLLCSGRPELLDERESWREHALVLGPLAPDDARALAAALKSDLAPDVQDRLVELAEGNPLFIEQLLAYAEERGKTALDSLPPSVEALLSARVDLLAPDVRDTARRAALIGREFSRAGLVALSTSESAPVLSAHLLDLVRRGFVHPARFGAEEEVYRFHHALVRDVAYAGLPKAERAELHEAFGDWLEAQPSAADEAVGYHLEQAYRYRAELGSVDRRAKQLAVDAGSRLGAAGMRAFRIGDMPTTTNLLERATVLLPDADQSRRAHLVNLGLTLDARNESERAIEALTKAVEESVAAGDRTTEMWARLEREFVELRRQPKRTADALLEAAREAIPVLESAGDHRAVGRALILFGWVQGARRCDNGARLQAAMRALDHYKAAGWSTSTCLGQISGALLEGPTPVQAAIERVQELLDRDVTDRAGHAYMLAHVSVLMAQRQEFDSARDRLSSAREILDELGLGSPVMTYTLPALASIELLAGRPAAAVSVSRQLCAELERSRNFNWLASHASLLAEALVDVGELDEALHWTAIAEEHAAADDLDAHMLWPPVRATVHQQREEFALAEPLAREAVALADRSDHLNRRARAHRVLAQVLRAMGNAAEARHALSRAGELYEDKGNAVGVAQIRSLQGDPATVST
jgi:DNA-binding SARP family transcriptional activator